MVSEQWYFSFLSLRIFYPLIYAYKQIIASPQIFNVFIYFKSSNRSILVDWRFVIFTIEIIHREFASIFSINSIKAITQSIVHNGNPRTFCVLWKSSCLEGYANFKLLSLQMARALNRAFPRFIVFFFFSYLLLRGILPFLERRIAIYNSRKWNYYSPRIENYHFSPIYFSRPPTRRTSLSRIVIYFLHFRKTKREIYSHNYSFR